MNDGTTPLILAARLAVEGMVAELINCQADVNAVDDHGRDEKQGFRLRPAKQASKERIIARPLKAVSDPNPLKIRSFIPSSFCNIEFRDLRQCEVHR